MIDTIKAWHFVGDCLRDGRPIPADGEWLVHTGPIEICASGLHASRRPWHALQYAPGAVLCYVQCRGDIHERDDKLVCRERRIIMRVDVTETLRFFARMQALSVIHLHRECQPDVVLDYLMTGDESIRAAAWTAARAAACDTAWSAASAAASAAAWDAASVAARDAAMAAAWDAASAAASVAASAAAKAAALDAESAAASAAARAALWDAAGLDLDALIYEQFGVAA